MKGTTNEQEMKFHVIWLCEGNSMMLMPRAKVRIDMTHAADVLRSISKKASELFVQFDWKGVQITLYRNGSMHFYHFIDVPLGRRYAQEILSQVGSSASID